MRLIWFYLTINWWLRKQNSFVSNGLIWGSFDPNVRSSTRFFWSVLVLDQFIWSIPCFFNAIANCTDFVASTLSGGQCRMRWFTWNTTVEVVVAPINPHRAVVLNPEICSLGKIILYRSICTKYKSNDYPLLENHGKLNQKFSFSVSSHRPLYWKTHPIFFFEISILQHHTDCFTGTLIHSNFWTETIYDILHLVWMIFPVKKSVWRPRILQLTIGWVFQ